MTTAVALLQTNTPAVHRHQELFAPGQIKGVHVTEGRPLEDTVMTLSWTPKSGCGLNRTSFYPVEMLTPEQTERLNQKCLKKLAAEESHFGFFSRKLETENIVASLEGAFSQNSLGV